jgi:aspartyl-tRNA synthetase
MPVLTRKPRVAAAFSNQSVYAKFRLFFEDLSVSLTEDRRSQRSGSGSSRPYFGERGVLQDALYKQMMMAAGFEKVFEIGPIFRAEEHNTTKHLNEATSIDIEVSFADHLEVMNTLEELVIETYRAVAEGCGDQLANLGITEFKVPGCPFPRVPYTEAIEIATQKSDEEIVFGDDISTAAEKAIGEEMGEHYFIVDWPTEIKPYYAMPR